MSTLSGKVAVVTGAGQGIGRSEALALARAGAHVVVNDVGAPNAERVAAEIHAAGGSAEANTDDIADWAGTERLIERAVAHAGHLDILVCNAGIIRDRTIVNMSEQEFDAVIRVHLRGHFAPLHFAADHWKRRAKEAGAPIDARVVTTSSEAGLYGNFGQVNYSAAKAGIVALTQVAARELASIGVRANAICPRARTPMTEGVVPDMDPVEGQVDEWDPEAVATWVTFLVGPSAARFTGQVFVVHGPTVSRMAEWQPSHELTTDGPLTLEALEAQHERLGKGDDGAIAAFADLLARSGGLR